MVNITGNTYPVKEQLKALGAKWNQDCKAWQIDSAKLGQAEAIVRGQTPAQAGKCSKCGTAVKAPYTICWNCRPAPTTCKQCGCRADRWNKIYKNGVCRNCYRDDAEEAAMGY